MPFGTPLDRQWVLVTRSGAVVVDWGEGMYQDLREGTFLELMDGDISHPASDDDLLALKFSGIIDGFTEKQVFFLSLPERPIRTIE